MALAALGIASMALGAVSGVIDIFGGIMQTQEDQRVAEENRNLNYDAFVSNAISLSNEATNKLSMVEIQETGEELKANNERARLLTSMKGSGTSYDLIVADQENAINRTQQIRNLEKVIFKKGYLQQQRDLFTNSLSKQRAIENSTPEYGFTDFLGDTVSLGASVLGGYNDMTSITAKGKASITGGK